uniref:Rab-like protein 6 n=1 Tax=Panagrolaimus sp. JU765 TaxID=591449 RepID=A0AC34Q8W6_9BILA
MFSAIKKKLGSSGQATSAETSKTPTGVNVVSAELQKKFAHGVNYNMKIVIRGDRNSGKTCLWKRIQGQQFCEVYNPTEEIQVASIMWNYRASDFIVKLDVWDVVDESPKRRQKSDGLKLSNEPFTSEPTNYVETPACDAGFVDVYKNCNEPTNYVETPACDAGFVDVYKNCNGVLMVFDITKPWTWNYIERELDGIPSHIPVLIMANKVDLESQRQVREDDVQYFLNHFKRKDPLPGKILAQIRYTQSSMKNAYGLKYLYNFLNIPFLFLQRQTLEAMLEANKREIEISYQEMDYTGLNKENYDSYKTRTNDEANHHEFSIDTKKAALNTGNSEVTNDEKHITQEMTRSPRKQLNSMSSEDHDNRMVDTFEEDFDSDDFYTKKLENIQPEIKKPEKIDIPKKKEVLSSSSVDTPVYVDPLKTPTEQNLRKSIDFDSWLEGIPSATSSSKPIKNDFFESSEEDETSNPLVTQVEDDSNDEMETIKSTEGSISAGSGFSVLPKKSPNDEALERPKLKSKKKDDGGKKKKLEIDTTKKKKKSKKVSNSSNPEGKNADREHYESL